MKQKHKPLNDWPLVRRPDSGSHERLMWVCKRKNTQGG